MLWEAERPPGSNDFHLRTEDDGTAVAVLPDESPDGSRAVSGYDLTTGELVWGPQEPPGPGSARASTSSGRRTCPPSVAAS